LNKTETPRWQRLLFLGGIIIGLALAALNALTGGQARNIALPPGAVARVNDATILRADLARALNAVSMGKRNAITDADKAVILQRLIEEELLVQRAMQRGLAEQDPTLRNALVNAVTRDIITRSRAKPVSPVRLRDYYFKNKARFARPERVFVRAVFLATASAAQKKPAFDAELRKGAKAEALVSRFGQQTPPIPNGLLPVRKLIDYVGVTPVAALKGLRPGQWTDWIKGTDGLWRLYLVNRTRARVPELESVRNQAEAAYLDERDDAALRTYIDRLKRTAKIELSVDAPQ
jgi:parvulin-like peptidyl-prolyl isomerase